MADKFAAISPALVETRPRASKLDLSTSIACAPSEERPQRLVLESWRSQDSQCHFRPPAKSESDGSCLPASAPSPVTCPIWKSRRAILESKDRGSREARYRHTFTRAPKTQVPSSTLCKSSTGALETLTLMAQLQPQGSARSSTVPSAARSKATPAVVVNKKKPVRFCKMAARRTSCPLSSPSRDLKNTRACGDIRDGQRQTFGKDKR